MMVSDPIQVANAREVFFTGKGLPVDRVGHAILRSWIRCSEMGLDEAVIPPAQAPTAQELRILQQRYEALRRISRPELDALYSEARELSGIVILTNAKGEILDAVGDPVFVDKAAQVALRPGARWSEDAIGTNAIGTALAERRAVAVNGGEHYFRGHGALSCAATPIIDPRGTTLGVLDMSTPTAAGGPHVLGMVRMAVEQIEHRLFRAGFDGCRTLRFQTDPNLLGAAREGILVLKDGIVVAANRRGLSLVGQTWDSLDTLQVGDLFDGPLSGGHLRGVDGRDYYGHIDGEEGGHDLPVRSLEDVELSTIRATLDAHGGNVSATAKALGIHRSTIYRRLGLG